MQIQVGRFFNFFSKHFLQVISSKNKYSWNFVLKISNISFWKTIFRDQVFRRKLNINVAEKDFEECGKWKVSAKNFQNCPWKCGRNYFFILYKAFLKNFPRRAVTFNCKIFSTRIARRRRKFWDFKGPFTPKSARRRRKVLRIRGSSVYL